MNFTLHDLGVNSDLKIKELGTLESYTIVWQPSLKFILLFSFSGHEQRECKISTFVHILSMPAWLYVATLNLYKFMAVARIFMPFLFHLREIFLTHLTVASSPAYNIWARKNLVSSPGWFCHFMDTWTTILSDNPLPSHPALKLADYDIKSLQTARQINLSSLNFRC